MLHKKYANNTQQTSSQKLQLVFYIGTMKYCILGVCCCLKIWEGKANTPQLYRNQVGSISIRTPFCVSVCQIACHTWAFPRLSTPPPLCISEFLLPTPCIFLVVLDRSLRFLLKLTGGVGRLKSQAKK